MEIRKEKSSLCEKSRNPKMFLSADKPVYIIGHCVQLISAMSKFLICDKIIRGLINLIFNSKTSKLEKNRENEIAAIIISVGEILCPP